MKEIGLRAYRFSVSWARVIPEGVGAVNAAGLSFYDCLVDELLGAGIDPWVTLFHWDYPHALHLRGGWLNPDSPGWVRDYAAVIVDALSDRVTNWITINEPQIFIGRGHKDGLDAPGLKLARPDWLRAGHHALMAHGLASEVIRSRAKRPPRIGWAPVGVTYVPATDSPADIDATRRQTMSVLAPDAWNNTLYADPVVLGHYPADALSLFGNDIPSTHDRDMRIIHQPLDFYGLNIYSATPVHANADGSPRVGVFPPGHPRNAFDWPVVPAALYWGPKFHAERYKLPIVITENGYSGLDWPDSSGVVHDPQRISYSREYLRHLRKASGEGVDVRGYFHWSLMDNFEWTQGYNQRFGLIHVDFATQKRTLKDSARWYADVIRTNADPLDRSDASTPIL
jgi:beta-glucosidase